MADTKITALAAITTVAPANDLFAIVDVSDNSMAASGTTKNITTNQILGAGGTATLASATITGDLTVDTNVLKVDSANNRVGIVNASPTVPLDVVGTIRSKNVAGDVGGLRMWSDSSGDGNIYEYFNGSLKFGVNDTLAMTLNSTGLGVGVASLTNSEKLNAAGTIVSTGASLGSFGVNQGGFDYNTSTRQLRVFSGTADATGSYISFVTGVSGTINEKMRIDSSGNVGISVTTFGTSAAKVLALGTGTEPTTGPAGTVQLFTSTRSASNTIPAIFTEGSGVTNAAITNTTVTNKIAIKVNGTIYYLLATTSAA
jgi:hypothetical protein